MNDVEVRYDVRIPTDDAGVSLAADIYFPVGAGPAPTLLVAIPYGKDPDGPIGTLSRWFAQHGYAAVVLDLRGTGSSDGSYREFAPIERNDLVATISWLATQPWCDGNVGMWGISYGGWTAVSAAASNPAPLKAIVAVHCPTDPERHLIHPDGARSDLRTCFRTLLMLTLNLTPPRRGGVETGEARRERLATIAPAYEDVVQQGPGDPQWREIAINPSAINTPTLLIGGWRDFVVESVIDAYAKIVGPKKLLLGPWGHALPHLAGNEPLDFPAIALRWFDHWLRGSENGVMDESPVLLHLPGAEPVWRAFDMWPETDDLRLEANGELMLTEPRHDDFESRVLAEYKPDATIGALRAFWGSTLGGIAPTPDQHDDDMRAISATSEPVPNDLLMVGRPTVVVSFEGHDGPQRLVATLTDVDPLGRSTLVTMGVATLQRSGSVVLRPTAWRFSRGHKLRVALSDSDFPRLTPLADAAPIYLASLELTVPILGADSGTATTLPSPGEGVVALDGAEKPSIAFTVTRELLQDSVEVALTTSRGGQDFDLRASVRPSDPTTFVVTGRQSHRVQLPSGEEMTIFAEVRCTQGEISACAETTVDDTTRFSRTWEASFGEFACRVMGQSR